MLVDWLWILGGIFLLYAGAEALVYGGCRLALILGIPKLVVGVVIVGIGTSFPEMISSLIAITQADSGDLAMANVLGSNVANLGLVLGVAAIIRPIPIPNSVSRGEAPVVVLITALFALMVLPKEVTRSTGVFLLAGLAGYLIYQIRATIAHRNELESNGSAPLKPLGGSILKEASSDLIVTLVGVAVVLIGGHFLIHGALAVARTLAVTERFIGLTIVAFGTSCPELATAIVAGLRGHHELSIGNLLGSCAFNLLAITGVCGVVSPFTFGKTLLVFDLPLVMALTFLVGILFGRGRVVQRWEGGLLLAIYGCYISWLIATH